MSHSFPRVIAAAAAVALSAAACGQETKRDQFPKPPSVATPAPTPAPAAERAGTASPPSPAKEPAPMPGVYDLKAKSLDGADVNLADYRGKVTLIVNVASECGFTPQYEGLQKLHAELSSKGFSVLGFPSNEFGGQEPGSPADIRQFCTSKYHVTFPLFAKVEVKKGAGQSPLYQYLGSVTGKEPNWNFCKYLVDKKGQVQAFYTSPVKPDDAKLRAAIDEALSAK